MLEARARAARGRGLLALELRRLRVRLVERQQRVELVEHDAVQLPRERGLRGERAEQLLRRAEHDRRGGELGGRRAAPDDDDLDRGRVVGVEERRGLRRELEHELARRRDDEDAAEVGRLGGRWIAGQERESLARAPRLQQRRLAVIQRGRLDVGRASPRARARRRAAG